MEVDVSVKIETIGDCDVKLEPQVTDPETPCLDDASYSDIKLEGRPCSSLGSDFSVQIIKQDVEETERLRVDFKNENDVYLLASRPLNDMDGYVDIGETEIVYPGRPQPGVVLNATPAPLVSEGETRKHIHNNSPCIDCDYKNKNEKNPQSHVTIHLKGKRRKTASRSHSGEKEKSFKCEICGYEFSLERNLKRHMITHTGEKPYKCKICNFRCNISSYIEIHMRIHTGEKPFKCDICDHNFIQKTTLIKHFRCKHSDIWGHDKTEICKICNYKSKKKTHMKVHKRTHTGEKPYQCDICDYSCTQKGSLTKHLRVHSKEKPYKCGMCVYKGRSASNLKQHLATHKGKQPFKCEVCDYKTMKTRHLKNHIMINHEEDIDVDIM